MFLDSFLLPGTNSKSIRVSLRIPRNSVGSYLFTIVVIMIT